MKPKISLFKKNKNCPSFHMGCQSNFVHPFMAVSAVQRRQTEDRQVCLLQLTAQLGDSQPAVLIFMARAFVA